MELGLYQPTTFSNILSSLHLIASQHPHFYIYITQLLLARSISFIV